MSELKRHFEGLMNFAKNSNFRQPFSQVYFAESKFIERFSDKPDELSRQNIFTIEIYEDRFDEILKQDYSRVNLSSAGMFDNNLLIVIELPRSKTDVKITAVNLSLPEKRVIENDSNISIKIV
jgi:hypothetical protein